MPWGHSRVATDMQINLFAFIRRLGGIPSLGCSWVSYCNYGAPRALGYTTLFERRDRRLVLSMFEIVAVALCPMAFLELLRRSIAMAFIASPRAAS